MTKNRSGEGCDWDQGVSGMEDEGSAGMGDVAVEGVPAQDIQVQVGRDDVRYPVCRKK